jgi:dipeptidyl aminopeptidase/acylaminoacyl peptidase
MRSTFTQASILLLCAVLSVSAQSRRPMQIDDFFQMKRIADPAVSPDGSTIVFTLTTPDVKANRSFSDLWKINADGTELKQLTNDPTSDGSAAWTPDGKHILWVSSRLGESQLWMMNPDGTNQKQITHISTGVSKPLLSSDGKTLAFVSEVFPEFSSLPFSSSDSLNRLRLEKMEKGPVKARLITQLLYRHWDSWVDGKRLHIFIQSFPDGEPRDVTPGDRDAVPNSSTFSAGTDYAFSPAGDEIAYTATPLPTHDEAWSTNHDIFILPLSGGAPKQLTSNPAADGSPVYSPDGRYIAYRAQRKPGFEGDRWEIMLYDRQNHSTRNLTSNFDAHCGEPLWAPDSKTIYFNAEKDAANQIFSVSARGNDVRSVIARHANSATVLTRDGSMLYFLQASAARPAELYSARSNGSSITQVTHINDAVFSTLDVPAPTSLTYTGAEGARVQGWLYVPPGFNPAIRYPLIVMVHGGPQGSWEDGWSYRWNPALWAAQGYVVFTPNPRGSTGFGQKFTDEISGDWGGKVYTDIMRGVDTVCSFAFVDSTRKGAAGASFGGYMMNWMLGHTDRFKAFVSHDGVYNFDSMYGSTDEIWFDEWEHGGAPWDKPEEYAKFSPNRFAKNFKTPTLIIHGARDFRIPETEAMQLFTALQRQGVPSEFLYFPDENHWVLKPANSRLWHETVFGWLKKWVAASGK